MFALAAGLPLLTCVAGVFALENTNNINVIDPKASLMSLTP